MQRTPTPGDRSPRRGRSLRRLLPLTTAALALTVAAGTWAAHDPDAIPQTRAGATAAVPEQSPSAPAPDPLDTSRISPPVASDEDPVIAFGADGTASIIRSAPPAGVDASPTPLGTPPVAAEHDSYTFMATQAGSDEPVAFDPCRPVHYVIRPDGAPPGGEQLIEEAVAAVSAATGLQFINDGPTAETPQVDRAPYQPDTYGSRWAPVLFAWSDPAETPDLADGVVGLGGGVPRTAEDGTTVLVSGHVILDGPELTEVARAFGGAEEVRTTITHELAHVVGLGHVDDPTQLMYPLAGDLTSFSAGDLAGLARLGAGQCAPDL